MLWIARIGMEPSEFVLEQRPDIFEPGRRPDRGVEPGKVAVGHYKFGQQLAVRTDQLPYPLGFRHRTVRAESSPSTSLKNARTFSASGENMIACTPVITPAA